MQYIILYVGLIEGKLNFSVALALNILYILLL